MVGGEASDDAAVYRLTDDLAVVLTVDAFTPIHDDPYVYGQIAAANSLSDIYAMGGRPFLALNVCGFPRRELELEVLAEILRGGSDKAAEAGVAIGGGHTLDSPEPFYGMAVLGHVHPDRVITNGGARPGDVLVLTKPLGSGIVVTAAMADMASPDAVAAAAAWMCMLNKAAAEAMVACGATAATDVTGFGLLGHGHEMAQASGLELEIEAARLPVHEAALEYAMLGAVPGGLLANLEWYGQWTSGLEEIPEALRYISADPQTSGGLLIALPPESVAAFLAAVPGARAIGSAGSGAAGRLRLS
jgi:selenide, water dikinase